MAEEKNKPDGLYNPVLCGERMGRLKSDIDQGLASLRQTIQSEKELAASVASGNQKAVGDALQRIENALDELKKRVDVIDDDLPTNCINRLVDLEGWRKYIIGGFATSSLFLYLLWKYVDHVLADSNVVVQAAEIIIKKFGG